MSTPRRKGSVDGRLYDFPSTGEYGYSRPVLDSIVDLAATVGQSDASITQRQLVSAGADPAETGTIRVSHADFIAWRNAANNADLRLGPPSTSDGLALEAAFLRGAPIWAAGTVNSFTTFGPFQAVVGAYGGTATILGFPYELLDTANAVSNGTFTAPATAVYLIAGQVHVQSNCTEYTLSVFINGVESQTNYRKVNSGTVNNNAMVHRLALLTAGDLVTIRITQNAGTPQTIQYQDSRFVILQLWGTHTP